MATVAIVSRPTGYTPGFNVSVSFIAYTNGTAGRFAMFSVSNTSGATLKTADYYDVEELTQARIGLGPADRLPSTSLGPATSCTLSVPVPTGSVPWRAIFYFSPDNLQRKLSDGFAGRRFVPEWICRPPPFEWTRTGWIDR